MAEHELKTWPEFYQAVLYGQKLFEVRKNDRDFKAGDVIKLREFDPEINDYTGSWNNMLVNYVLEGGQFGIEEGYVVLSLWPKGNGVMHPELFDGFAVYEALTEDAARRTSPENVSDVLDAVVRLIRKAD